MERSIEVKDRLKEIREAKWVSWNELQGSIRNNLICSPFGLFHYRVKLTDQIEKVIKARKKFAD